MIIHIVFIQNQYATLSYNTGIQFSDISQNWKYFLSKGIVGGKITLEMVDMVNISIFHH